MELDAMNDCQEDEIFDPSAILEMDGMYFQDHEDDHYDDESIDSTEDDVKDNECCAAYFSSHSL